MCSIIRTVKVTRLIRVSYGDYQLQTIPPGMAIEVPAKPIEKQRHLGPLFPKRAKTKQVGQQQQGKQEDVVEPVQWIRNV